MDVRPIRTDEDHRAALEEMERLWNAPEGSDEEARLDVLATLVEAYEDKTFKLPNGAPAEVLAAVMAEKGFSQKDLGDVIGSRSRASEILKGKRPPSVEHIRRIRASWGIPADALLGEVNA